MPLDQEQKQNRQELLKHREFLQQKLQEVILELGPEAVNTLILNLNETANRIYNHSHEPCNDPDCGLCKLPKTTLLQVLAATVGLIDAADAIIEHALRSEASRGN